MDYPAALDGIAHSRALVEAVAASWVVTCAGCIAYSHGHAGERWVMCQELRADDACQKKPSSPLVSASP